MSHGPNAEQKVTARHLSRLAYLYVRQSTMKQVKENSESTDRQYALRSRATALGWASEDVVVVDADLGQSGATAVDREGFKKLVVDVGLGKAGIVLGLEVSRLARNSADWHRLLEICALTDTLILDEDGIYDPTHFNDRLLLGLKGTMSEAELHMLRARMRGGLINKARRGELRLRLPVGYVYDHDDKVVLDPDKQVQESVRLLFETYARTGRASKTVSHFRKEGLLYPQRVFGGRRSGELAWSHLSLTRVSTALHNPWYAGAYVYGRSRCRKLPSGKVSREHLSHGEWLVHLPDAHPQYISWEQFVRNEKNLAAAAKASPFGDARGVPREGPALLQGRVFCGLCGGRMSVRYGSRRGSPVTNYLCGGPGKMFGDALCQSVVGTKIDEAISELLVQSVTPVALQLTLAVQNEVQSRIGDADRLRYRQVERIEFETEQARARYMLVDPANRLVADSLEATWNGKLRELSDARLQYEKGCADDLRLLKREEEEQILALATDFPKLWNDPRTPQRERKRILALLIDDVTLVKGREVTVSVRFRGGETTTLTLPRPLFSYELRTTKPEVVELIKELSLEYTDAQVAHSLNERGKVTGTGVPFDGASVQWVRKVQKFRSLKQKLLDEGWVSSKDLGTTLGVGRSTLRRRHLLGELKARLCNDQGQWLYWPPDTPYLGAEADSPQMDTLGARGAV